MLDNAKSIFIINKIFTNLRNKKKLNIIKYNKRLLNKLNITKEDFNMYLMLKIFNTKYKTKLEDIEIKEINLDGIIKNEALKDLCEIKFKRVYKLSLCENAIWDINSLEKLNLKNLKILKLRYNSISDISVLGKVKFEELKELNLYKNNIPDINVLKNVKFEKLELLNLSRNIDILE